MFEVVIWWTRKSEIWLWLDNESENFDSMVLELEMGKLE